jgi:predicted amidohydrolase YtcJ
MIKIQILFLLSVLLFISCKEEVNDQIADRILFNADVYTVDETSEGNFIVIKDGRIIAVGKDDYKAYKGKNTELIDLKGNFVMPGFIEGHGHFSGLGYSLLNLNFLKSKSWEEIIAKVKERVDQAKPGEWIDGRGWHQEKWDSIPFRNVLGYPYHEDLSKISPNNPVILTHASGHSLFANEAAMKAAGITVETPDPAGGLIVKDGQKKIVGVFEERAMQLIRKSHQDYLATLDQSKLDEIWYDAIDKSVENCLQYGVTSFQDAGSRMEELKKYEELAKNGKLGVRLWAMVRHNSATMAGKLDDYKRIGVGGDFYTCNAIKSEVDGALGAFGAWLLKPYSDKPGFYGQNTTDIYEVKKIADIALQYDMQFCVHAIGDRANNVVLDIYEGVLSQSSQGKNKRWRIEHAQHLDTSDFNRFAEFGIIASMQGIHCTSDAPFVEKRLGRDRAKYGSYAWRSLLDKGVVVANGTDAPVEDLSPLESFYASVTRRRPSDGMVFYKEQSMTRQEAIYSYTLGNAYAAFEEDIKGSISKGKYADLVVLSKNLVTCSDDDILKAQVLYTFVGGKPVYQQKNVK